MQERTARRFMQKPVRNIFFWMTVFTPNRILKVLSMYVHRRSARKKIRTACGRHWQTRRSRRWQQTSAALRWLRKPSEKMTSPGFREDFREFRQEELFSILMELRPERSRRSRCVKSSVKIRQSFMAYIRIKVRSHREATQIS